MLILGLETSTDVCSVGYVDDEGSELEVTEVASRIHSEKLLTMIEELLKRGGRKLRSISGVAVSLGPGSFTGLRIGLSAAKGLCWSLERPLLAIPTFDAFAAKAIDVTDADELILAADAKQGEYYLQQFKRNGERFRPLNELQVVSLGIARKLLADHPGAVVATDSHRMAATMERARKPINIHLLCSGISVARLGMQKFLAKEFADLASLEPMYLKDFIPRSKT